MNINRIGARTFTIGRSYSDCEVATWEIQTVLTCSVVFGVLRLRPQNVYPREKPSTHVHMNVTGIIWIKLKRNIHILSHLFLLGFRRTKLHGVRSQHVVRNSVSYTVTKAPLSVWIKVLVLNKTPYVTAPRLTPAMFLMAPYRNTAVLTSTTPYSLVRCVQKHFPHLRSQ